MSVRKNSSDYRQGYDAEMARQATRGYDELARQVARNLGRDNALKQRIIQRAPQAFYGMDAEELGTASAGELATRELRELGITPRNSDPIELLDAHHAGRQYERGKGVRGSARDSASNDSVVGRYLNAE